MKPSDKIFLFSKTPHHDVQHIPIIKTTYTSSLPDLTIYEYLLVTSKEAINAFHGTVEWKEVPIIAISKVTADYAIEKGGKVTEVGDGYAENLVDVIAGTYPSKKILYIHAEKTAYDLEGALSVRGLNLDSWVAYKTQCNDAVDVDLPPDAICIFTSPSTIDCFMKKYAFLPSYQVVCIGETTAKALPKGIDYLLSSEQSITSTIERAKTLLK